jgi:hypothetical protein
MVTAGPGLEPTGENVDDHIGRMDAFGHLRAGGCDRRQAIRERGGENGHHLPVSVIGTGEFAPHAFRRAGSTQSLNGGPLR